MLPVVTSYRLGASLLSAVLLTSCVSYPRVDARPMEQQLADRPAPTFTAEEINTFATADRTKPFRWSFRGGLRSCVPLVPPARAMNREKANRVDGTVSAVVLANGLFDSVRAVNVVPESLTADVEATFALALKTQPCRLPPLASPLTVEIPFILRLE